MEPLIIGLLIISILANVAIVLAVIVMTQSIKSRLDNIDETMRKQSELIIIMSQFMRKEDLKQQTERLIFDKIQSSLRAINNRFRMYVVDEEKPLDFPNDDK